MSRLKQRNGDDYPEAALKHLQDADALVRGRRFDGAAYLAGYVVECALKTLIQVESGEARHGHKLTKLIDVLDELAVHAKTDTGRFYISAAASLKTADVVVYWKPNRRYHGPGIAANKAEVWLREAHATYERVVGSLMLDGAI